MCIYQQQVVWTLDVILDCQIFIKIQLCQFSYFQINVVISRFLRLTWCLILTLLAELIFNWSCESILLEVIVTFYVQILVQRSISLLSCFDPIFCFYLAFYIALIPPLHRLQSCYFFPFVLVDVLILLKATLSTTEMCFLLLVRESYFFYYI